MRLSSLCCCPCFNKKKIQTPLLVKKEVSKIIMPAFSVYLTIHTPTNTSFDDIPCKELFNGTNHYTGFTIETDKANKNRRIITNDEFAQPTCKIGRQTINITSVFGYYVSTIEIEVHAVNTSSTDQPFQDR